MGQVIEDNIINPKNFLQTLSYFHPIIKNRCGRLDVNIKVHACRLVSHSRSHDKVIKEANIPSPRKKEKKLIYEGIIFLSTKLYNNGSIKNLIMDP